MTEEIARDSALGLSCSSPEGVKNDSGKLRKSLLPQRVLDQLLGILEAGAKEYGDWNWYKGINYSRLLDAADRHIAAIRRGEERSDHPVRDASGDINAGFHAGHAIVELIFLLTFQMEKRGNLNDLLDPGYFERIS